MQNTARHEVFGRSICVHPVHLRLIFFDLNCQDRQDGAKRPGSAGTISFPPPSIRREAAATFFENQAPRP